VHLQLHCRRNIRGRDNHRDTESQRETKAKKIKEKRRRWRDGEKRIKKRIRTQIYTDEHR